MTRSRPKSFTGCPPRPKQDLDKGIILAEDENAVAGNTERKIET